MQLRDFYPNMALMRSPLNYAIIFLMIAFFLFILEICVPDGDYIEEQ